MSFEDFSVKHELSTISFILTLVLCVRFRSVLGWLFAGIANIDASYGICGLGLFLDVVRLLEGF